MIGTLDRKIRDRIPESVLDVPKKGSPSRPRALAPSRPEAERPLRNGGRRTPV